MKDTKILNGTYINFVCDKKSPKWWRPNTQSDFVVTNDAVTTIGENAYKGNTKLVRASFPNVTSIGAYAFQDCTSLQTVYFPKLTNITGQSAFGKCTSLTTADFPLLESVAFLGQTFFGCTALTAVNLPLLTTIGANDFQGCTSLTSVVFPSATATGQTAFRECTSLTTADFPIATKVEQRCFLGCTALTALILRNSETVCTLVVNAFSSTPIADGTGYVYVPAALVDSYKADSKWSTFAAQIRALEDYTVDGTITGELDETKI